MGNEGQVKQEIQKVFGFPLEIIERAVKTGAWQVYFQIKGITYYGWITDMRNHPKIQTVDGEVWNWFDYLNAKDAGKEKQA